VPVSVASCLPCHMTADGAANSEGVVLPEVIPVLGHTKPD